MNLDRAILPIKINELVGLISKHKLLTTNDALAYLYSSDFYKQLLNPDTKWWYASGEILYRELQKEKKKIQSKNKLLNNEQLFLVFCAENYKNAKQMDAMEVYALFQKLNVFSFLIENYEILHTQGERYIIDEIDSYINCRK